MGEQRCSRFAPVTARRRLPNFAPERLFKKAGSCPIPQLGRIYSRPCRVPCARRAEFTCSTPNNENENRGDGPVFHASLGRPSRLTGRSRSPGIPPFISAGNRARRGEKAPETIDSDKRSYLKKYGFGSRSSIKANGFSFFEGTFVIKEKKQRQHWRPSIYTARGERIRGERTGERGRLTSEKRKSRPIYGTAPIFRAPKMSRPSYRSSNRRLLFNAVNRQ